MKSTERRDTITNDQLQAEFKKTGLTAAEIRKYSYDMISVNQAHQWLKYFERKEPMSMSIPTKVLLWKICQEKQSDLGTPSAPAVKSKLRDTSWEADNVARSQHNQPIVTEPLPPWMCSPSVAKVTLAEGEFKVKENKDGTDKIGFRYRGTLFAGDYHGEGDYQLDRVAVHIPNLRAGTFIIL